VEEVKLVELSDNEVRYKRYSLQDGPLFVKEKKTIHMIKFESGEKRIFDNAVEVQTAPVALSFKSNAQVFFECENYDEYNVQHSLIKKLRKWKKWTEVKEREKADYVFNIKVSQQGAALLGYIIFKDARGGELGRTGTVKAYTFPIPYQSPRLNRHALIASELFKIHIKGQ
jgi:hypothetical protein